MENQRRIIQIVVTADANSDGTVYETLHALDNAGALWRLGYDSAEWQQVKGPPLPEPKFLTPQS